MTPIQLERSILRRRIGASRLFVLSLLILVLGTSPGWHKVSVAAAHTYALFGVLLAMAGALGRVWCSAYISGNKNWRLVTDGPYSLCRNPLYFFSFVGALGVGITTETLTIPGLIAVGFASYYPFVIRREEARLQELHGAAFEAYCRSTPRFWPASLRTYREPERSEISTAAFRHSLTEVAWFVVAALALHWLDDVRQALHASGWLALY